MLSKILSSLLITLTATLVSAQTVQPWMSGEVGMAWKSGYRGQETTVTVVDDFKSNYFIRGKLTNTIQAGRHGQWTALEANLIAPLATFRGQDTSAGTGIPLAKGMNIINLSYGMMGPSGYGSVAWRAQEKSIIEYAQQGKAIIAKAAGNDSGIAVGAVTTKGQLDYLNRDLIGAKTAIFVGALNTNGTIAAKAARASYSNVPGSNPVIQNQFLMVGVESHKTGLAGTSFAAPIVSGYAAILGSKFKTSTPEQITNQLLTTARKDTIVGYNPAIHGRGEASISRALSPVSIK